LALAETHAHQIELRGGNATGMLEGFAPRILARNLVRQRLDFWRVSANVADASPETMAERIARDARLADGGLRTGALARIGTIGLDLAQAGHSEPPGGMIATAATASCNGAEVGESPDAVIADDRLIEGFFVGTFSWAG